MSKKSIDERLAYVEDALRVGDTLTTRVLVIQDRSGSMGSRIPQTISGYNEYIGDLANDNSDEAFLTLVQFDDRYEVKEESTPVAKVNPLDEETFVPRGMTALLDAVGRGITEFKRTLGKDDRAFVVIMTDGGENNSREWTSHQVSDLIRECEDTGHFTFIFLGAGQDSWSGGQLLGLRRNQAAFYGAGAHNHAKAFSSLTSTTRRYRGSGEMAMAAPGATVSSLMANEGAEVELETNSTTGKEESDKKSSTAGDRH